MKNKLKKLAFIVIAIFITVKAQKIATSERGYLAVGGEFLLVPAVLGVKYLYTSIKAEWSEDIE